VLDEKIFRLGILGSGKGSNMVAIADACRAGVVRAEVSLVLSDVEGAGILRHAANRSIPCDYLPPGKYRTKLDEASEQNYIERLKSANVDLVVLAGFMRILKGQFLNAFPQQVVNIHPSLLPSFPGLEAWKQALDYGVKVSGCTVHYVDQGIDSGAIIGQLAVPIHDRDTAETLHERIQEAERTLYPKCIGALADSQVHVCGRRTFLKS
jgi:phosphoribosylglycinamide formyltransferase 1